MISKKINQEMKILQIVDDFKPVPYKPFDNLYEINSQGLVKSLPREISNNSGQSYIREALIIKPRLVTTNRVMIDISIKDGPKKKRKTIYPIVEVAKLFLNADISKFNSVPIDGNPFNTNVSNIKLLLK